MAILSFAWRGGAFKITIFKLPEYIEKPRFLTDYETMISFFHFLFLGVFFASGSVALAQLDYSAAFDSRTTPVAAQVSATAGYSYVIHGSPADASPFYGYVRPTVTLATSSTFTGIAALEIYPVSFFGFKIGRSFNNRFADLPGLDCGLSDCRNWLNFDFVQVRLLGKYKKLLGSVLFEKSFYNENDTNTSYADGTNVVYLAPQGEEGHRWQGILAYNISAEWIAGVLAWDFRTKVTRQSNDYQVVFMRRNFDDYDVTVGVGRFGSTQYGVEPTGILSFEWTGEKKVGP